MRVLVLGGTAWFGRTIAAEAVARGHDVTCLARGESGSVATGVTWIKGDRSDPASYDPVRDTGWDMVVDVARQPGQVRTAIAALADRARHWSFVSTGNVYATQDKPGADESAALLEPTADDVAETDEYGPGKVACENALRAGLDQRLLIARSGLIGGPGDPSDRAGAWVARCARDMTGPMLIPDSPEMPVQVIDIRDFASWLLDCGERQITGTFNASGPQLRFADWIELCRTVASHTGPLILADGQWLLDHGVEEYMGEGSFAMWLHDPAYAGWSARSIAAATAAGLTHRRTEETLRDILGWELELGLDRVRKAGLSPEREAELIAALG